jgi:hypothetical protein
MKDCDPKEFKRVCRLIIAKIRDWWPDWSEKSEALPFTSQLLEVILEATKDANLCCVALRAIMQTIPQPETAKAIQKFGFFKIQGA